MTVFGIDYAWGRPGTTALKNAGAKFVCRYLSHTPAKNLTRAEAAKLTAAGLWIVVVWETTASRALAGHDAGVEDAKDAHAQAKACGMPERRPIFFAVDWDATAAQQTKIHAYLNGVASVIGRDRVGLYGGYDPIRRAFDAGKIRYGWQTYGWSEGRWDGRAKLQQYSNSHKLNGVSVDYNRATATDYGQWQIGKEPHTGPTPTEKIMKELPIVKRPNSDYKPHPKDVMRVQGLLRAAGHDNVAIDGTFGDITEHAVEAEQGKAGVTVDGIVGVKQTWPVLLGIY